MLTLEWVPTEQRAGEVACPDLSSAWDLPPVEAGVDRLAWRKTLSQPEQKLVAGAAQVEQPPGHLELAVRNC